VRPDKGLLSRAWHHGGVGRQWPFLQGWDGRHCRQSATADVHTRARWSLLLAVFLAFGTARAVDLADPDWRWSLPAPLHAPNPVTFRALDLDRDGALSREEANLNPVAAAHFARADVDGDGRLSPLEYNHLALLLSNPRRPA